MADSPAGEFPPQRRTAPLPEILTLTFLSSIGTGALTNGVFFLTESPTGYGFSRSQNFLLAVVQGSTYVLAAFFAGPLLRRLTARVNWLTMRKLLIAILMAAALLAALPWVVRTILVMQGTHDPAAPTDSWAVWVVALTYFPLTGLLWPITEGFLAGGRTEQDLRWAVGRFNIVWTFAVFLAFWIMAPLVEHFALSVTLIVAGTHVLSLVPVLRFPHEPGRRDPESHEQAPASYQRLLRVFHLLLPVSYLVMSALSPYLPWATRNMDIAPDWRTPLASIWMGSRVAIFILMERWHVWHGRASVAPIACVLLLGGFVGAMLAPVAGSPNIATGVLVVSLAAFGAGMAAIYHGALYYAMEVGSESVDAGGTHEALIGIGYTLGPACGLAVATLVRTGTLSPQQLEPGIAVLVGGVASCVIGTAFARNLRSAERAAPSENPESE